MINLRFQHKFTSLWKMAMALVIVMLAPGLAGAQSVRQERRAIDAGNSLYKEGRYAEAIQKYKAALMENDKSDVARFNLGLSQIRMSEKSGKQQKDSVEQALYRQGVELLTQVAQIGEKKADLSSKANYNLGNLQFEQEDYANAIKFYKQALRLNPDFANARRNLRIAQLRLQDQQQDKNDDKKDQQDQQENKDQQDQQNEQDKQENQDQQNKQDQQQQEQQQEERRNEINSQAAQQILNAVENSEAQTRMRLGSSPKNEKSKGTGRNQRRW